MPESTQLTIPDLSLVILIGASGSGKSTFARTHFLPTEILSSDECRALVSDDENAMEATRDAFDVLHYIAGKRLARGKLTVIDATNVKREDRTSLVELARRHHMLPVAIVLNLSERICQDRNRERTDRSFGPHVVRNHTQQLRKSLASLKREGFRTIHILSSPEEVDSATIVREPLWNNRTSDHGPFDIIGDVHGCTDELEELLGVLGYQRSSDAFPDALWQAPLYRHPEGRKAIFLGDLGDRGPRILDAFRIVRAMVNAGQALCIPGNHDIKLMRRLRGRDVQITHGLDTTLAEIEALPEAQRAQFVRDLADFLDRLVSHYILDGGNLVVAHAGLKEEMHGRGSGGVREFALYGETTGETDEFGLPVRYNWAAEYRGKATVVYGHTPVAEPEWINRTINIDTGCVFGGRLSALRYPEREVLSVPARRTYYESVRPFIPQEEGAPGLSGQQALDDVLDLEDVAGKRFVSTRLHRDVTVREENATAALEVMSRFAVNPKWLVYLPPTMSPSETSTISGLLEHPPEAFSYYQREGVPRVICEEKHMGSRAVIVLGCDEQAALRRFGVQGDGIGAVYTRTGRPFFDPATQADFLERVAAAAERSGLWSLLETDWVVLDTEIMPWSAKAQDLVKQQYAPVGAAGRTALGEAITLLERTADRGLDTAEIRAGIERRREAVVAYTEAYGRYCWPAASIDDLRVAPFHILASESGVHADRDHLWHLNTAALLHDADERLFIATRHMAVDLTDAESMEAGIAWWEGLTESGSEGMVVKPLEFVVRGKKGLVQPALKCRGREYLRIIYGPEYTFPQHLDRLRRRNVGAKRSLAAREFALGIEGLERFARGEPLRRIHECAFAVLALESEPVDPRL